MTSVKPSYPLKSLDFLLNPIGFDIETAKGLDKLGKDEVCDFHVNSFLDGITNGEYILAVYNCIQSLINDRLLEDIDDVQLSVFYIHFQNTIDLLKDRINDWDFVEIDGLDCWRLYAVCANNLNSPIWPDDQGKPLHKPKLTSLMLKDWEFIFDVIEEDIFYDFIWPLIVNYKELDEKPINPSKKQYDEALAWLFESFKNTWINRRNIQNREKKLTAESKNVNTKHDFFGYMKIIKDNMGQEYNMIRSRVKEDPGTAGDQVEEHWAEFLRKWLPANFPIVTKGRLIDVRGRASPQVDILVLDPSYPLGLRDKKYYFIGGVIAVFECKLTLRKEHFKKFFNTSSFIKNMLEKKAGNPFDELCQRPIVGLLAHSHNFSGKEDVHSHIHDLLYEVAISSVSHPRELPDILSISDIGTYCLVKDICIGKNSDLKDEFKYLDKMGGIITGYTGYTEDYSTTIDLYGEILGALIWKLTNFMAYQYQNLRPFANYLSELTPWIGIGSNIFWEKTVLSSEVGKILLQRGFDNSPWSKWKESY